jgi:hypothetical protein
MVLDELCLPRDGNGRRDHGLYWVNVGAVIC